ncbi:hypothetical protein M8818_003921 [Zalaria obscura]|uniref:Uncharacterized protein n=1 Tax=Zalaria obscura TaxID=2024903 RepID=A0ACC3SHE3_9PEZI
MGDVAGSSAAPAVEEERKPAVLIIGGLGRHLAYYIHTNSLASTLRIVDKQLPELALLAPEHEPACKPYFLQADASRPASLARIFDLPQEEGLEPKTEAGTAEETETQTQPPTGGEPKTPMTEDQPAPPSTPPTKQKPTAPRREFDYIFNCGGETRFSQDDEVYKARSYNLSLNIGQEAAKRGIPAFIELSTCSIYTPSSPSSPAPTEYPSTPTRLKPHSKQAKWKLAAEDALRKIPGLRLTILRLPHVYGDYVGNWLGTQLALARTYKELGKTMKWLWSPDLRTHTVGARACRSWWI